MNQYERIVSYIYQYNHGEKGANVGYARVEKRGNICRIAVQMRAVPVNKAPQVYLFRQLTEGIQTVFVGQMTARGSNLLCKASSDAAKLFNTYEKIDDMEGIFIYVENNIYFATSWKNDTFYLGDWKNGTSKEQKVADTEEAATKEVPMKPEHLLKDTEKSSSGSPSQSQDKEQLAQDTEQPEQRKEQSATAQDDKSVAQSQGQAIKGAEPIIEGQEQVLQELDLSVQVQEVSEQQMQAQEQGVQTSDTAVWADKANEYGKQKKNVDGNDIQMQSICGVCPFKRRVYDYGKKILMTFPSMKPFDSGVAKACVRMELQDIGCLPIASWSLSGNRFLLHGYYCYRHLIFAQLADGKYFLGVPGIYNDKEKSNAIRFGFSKFQSIGDFGQKQGAFGYWMMALPESHNSELFN